ncbi:hypothetical protein Ddye_003727 [Dipteronia dyeriana]|uniref:TF-B3 domain-containing protein n=1 Tax=Dipteronia dyeriana TaxID=168575 RepID=A0AAD9XU71_9ROSI|nr:hypothetical protein Ddye_003727 [Dipteronia dyeriana]
MAMEDTPQHFFKVILASTLQDKKLRIPDKFVREFGDELLAFATVTVPDGRVWRVGLYKDGEKNWFHHGWPNFIEYYSIRDGYFLVFEYKKRSNFHVIILDTSNLEIDYPYNFERSKKEVIHHGETKKESEMPRNKCKMEGQVEVNTNTVHNGEDEHATRFKDNENLHKLKALLEDKRISFSRNYKFSSAKEIERLFTLVSSLKPRNPSFIIMLRPSHLYSRVVYLPAKFVNKYLTRDIELNKLRASNGREWPVQIGWMYGGCNTMQGWTEFLNDTKLKVGDICVFELIRIEDLLLDVSVFKES